MVPSLLVLAFVLIVAVAVLAARRRAARGAYLDAYRFPAGIAARVRRRYPHLTEADVDLVFDALRDYFRLNRAAGGQTLAMPSQVVDVAWHEFILFTRAYREFCRRALGRFLHHTPAEAMPAPTEATEGIRRTWRLACQRAGLSPDAPATLPLLFAIDDRLQIPDGFRYVPDCTRAPAARADRPVYCGAHIGCAGGGLADAGESAGAADGGGGGCGGD